MTIRTASKFLADHICGLSRLVALLVILLLAVGCAQTAQTPATPSPTPAATPSAAPALSASATPTPAKTPSPAPTAASGPAEGQPLVPGGPAYFPAKVAKESRAGEIFDKYSNTKLPLWTKAVYGGEVIASGTGWNPTVFLDPLRTSQISRNHYFPTLLTYDIGRCSLAGREGRFDTCDGQFAHHNEIFIIPSIFEKWEQKDTTTYVFTLRKGVLWPAVPPMTRSDRTVTIDDIIWFLNINKTEGVLRTNLTAIQKIEALDRNTLQMTLSSPEPELLRHLSHSSMGIFPKECYDDKGCLGSKQITPAPMLMTVSEARVRLVLERNPEYWLKGLPYIDRATWITIVDPSAQKAALIAGRITLAPSYASLTELEDLLPRLPGQWTAYAQTHLAAAQVIQGKMEGPMADARVRRAMTMAMDLVTGWNVAYEGFEMFSPLVSRDFFGPGFTMSLDQAGQWYQYNPQKAKQLLTEAGFPTGFTIPVATNAISGPNYDILLFLQSQWKKNLNVDLKITSFDPATYTQQRNEGTWQGLIWKNVYNDGAWATGQESISRLTKGSPLNTQRVDDAEISDIFSKYKLEQDPAKRVALLWQFEQRELDQVYELRLGTVNFLVPVPRWEMNGAGHWVTAYTGIYTNTGLSMRDPSRTPK